MCFHFLHVGHRCGPSIIIGRTWDDVRAKVRNNHLELDCPIPHVFLTVEKMLPDEEYSYPEDFDFDGMDAFTEMSDTQTDLVARVFFTVDEAKRHVLGFKAIHLYHSYLSSFPLGIELILVACIIIAVCS